MRLKFTRKWFLVFRQNLLQLMLIMAFMSASFVQAQQAVKGTVTDALKNALAGVNVTIKGTTAGTITDLNGKFSIKSSVPTDVLVFSFVGYVTQELPINGQTEVNVILAEEVKKLEEVVVIGYGVQKKSDLTGAVASVSSEDLNKTPVYSVENALQGRAAGVFTSQNTGAPGANVTIMIRGITSINGTNPLWVVDGVPADPKSVNASDIESIDILKDASAGAIYGSQGANGVVLVTTKKGKLGGTKATFDTYWGWQKVTNRINVANGPEFARMYTEYQALIKKRKFMFSNPDTVATYDYQSMIFRTAPMKNYDLGVSGGNDKSTFYLGIGYITQDGVLRNSAYDKMSLRLNSDHKLNKWLKVGENMSFTRQKFTGWQEWQLTNEYHTPILQAINYSPFVPPYDTTGNWSFTPLGNTPNPIGSIELLNYENTSNSGNATFYGIIEPIKGLTYENRITGSVNFSNNYTYSPIFFITPSNKNSNSQINRGSSNYYSWLWQHILSYNTTLFGAHNISLMAGFEAGYNKSEWMGATRWDLVNESKNMWYFDASQNDTLLSQLPTGSASEQSGYSYFGRFSYDYKGIVLGQANFRRDGSSKFGPRKRFGNFPSFSVGFKFSELDFIKNSLSFLNFGKIRFGWGKSGNNVIPDNVYYPTIGMPTVFSYTFDNNPSNESLGAAPNKMPNLVVSWESVVTSNFGLDLGFLGNRLNITVDYFQRHNEGMLMVEQAAGYAGFIIRSPYQENNNVTSDPIVNVGNISNTGVEFSATWKDTKGKIRYSASFNFTYVQTKTGKISPDTLYQGSAKGVNGFLTETIYGQPIGIYYGYETDGLFRPGEVDTVAGKALVYRMAGGKKVYQPNSVRAGDFRFKDINGDGIIDGKDIVPIGNPNPPYLFGLNLNVEFWWLDITAFFQGVAGNKIFNATKFYLFNMDGAFNYSADYVNDHYREDIYDRTGKILLFPANRNAKYPRIDPLNTNKNFSTLSDFYMENGSYLRLKNLQCGLTLPTKWTNLLGIEKFRLYFSVSNLFTITKYSGYDPEIGSDNLLVRGLDKAAYPLARMTTVGLNVTF